jgi:hypothetical protein
VVVVKVDVGVELGRVVKVEVGVIVGVAVDDVDVDVDGAGDVRPPQVQAPSVPRGI